MRSWHWRVVSLFPESLLRLCELALMPLNRRGAWHTCHRVACERQFQGWWIELEKNYFDRFKLSTVALDWVSWARARGPRLS